MPTINYTRPFLYPYQTAILNSPARFTVTVAATKVGKTASHIVWLFEQALNCKANQSVWWIAPTVGQAKIAFDRMKVQISNKDLFKANETQRTITLITGAIMEFKTAEKPDNLYGEDVYAAVYDEYTRGREASWHALRSTLTATGGKCKFIGNAKGKKNWGYKLALKAKTGDDPNYEYFKITAYDAADAGMMTKDGRPFIEEIEDAKKDLPESVFKELYLAEASEDGSNPFGLDYISRCTYPMSIQPSVCFGNDLAKKSDYTVIAGLDKFGALSHFDRFQKDWKQTKETILSLPSAPLAIDSTGVGDPIAEDIATKRDNVHLVVFTSRSKQQMMEGLAYAIQNREISFPEGVLKEELESFEFEYTRTGVKYSAPEGAHDDCVCALALAYSIWKESRLGSEISIW
jgi:hypothetical protein